MHFAYACTNVCVPFKNTFLLQEQNEITSKDIEEAEKGSDDTASQGEQEEEEDDDDGWTVVKKGTKSGQAVIPGGTSVVLVDGKSGKINIVNGMHKAEDAMKAETDECSEKSEVDMQKKLLVTSAASIAKKKGRRRHSSDSDLLTKHANEAHIVGSGSHEPNRGASLPHSLSDTESLNLEVICSRPNVRGILKKNHEFRSMSECSIESGVTEDFSCTDADLIDVEELDENGLKRKKSVTFSEKVSRATFKTTALVGVIRTRKRKPKKKKDKKGKKLENGDGSSSDADTLAIEKQTSFDSQEEQSEEESSNQTEHESLESFPKSLESGFSQGEPGVNAAEEKPLSTTTDSTENDDETDPGDEATNSSKKNKKRNKKKKNRKGKSMKNDDTVLKDVNPYAALSWSESRKRKDAHDNVHKTKSEIMLRNNLVYALED